MEHGTKQDVTSAMTLVAVTFIVFMGIVTLT